MTLLADRFGPGDSLRFSFVCNPAKCMKSSDYPLAMRAAGRRAIVPFRLNVDAGSVPTACHIRQSTPTAISSSHTG